MESGAGHGNTGTDTDLETSAGCPVLAMNPHRDLLTKSLCHTASPVKPRPSEGSSLSLSAISITGRESGQEGGNGRAVLLYPIVPLSNYRRQWSNKMEGGLRKAGQHLTYNAITIRVIYFVLINCWYRIRADRHY